MAAVHLENYAGARSVSKELLDAAQRGVVVAVKRDHVTAAVVDGERLRRLLAAGCPSRARVVPEDGRWSLFGPGLPVAADGATLVDAVADMIDALREYGDDWQERLLNAPNHRDNWALVQLVGLSTDEQLREWLVGTP